MSAPDWEEAMNWWRIQPEPIHSMIQRAAVETFRSFAGDGYGCSSSDINHTVYGMYRDFKHYEAYQEENDLPVSVVDFLLYV